MNILWLTRDTDSPDAIALASYFENCDIGFTISESKTDINQSHDLVIVSNYDQIIEKDLFNIPKKGMVVIHSSDLPKGRGWAPIYNCIANADKEFVVSLIKIDEKVDSGNILMKLRIQKPRYISNDNLRRIDQEATVEIVKEFVNNISNDSSGMVQENANASYHPKRTPEQNKLDPDKTIKEVILEILATNANYPAFIELDGCRVELQAKTIEYKLKDLSNSIERF
ncbi:MAG: hypothetical protein A2Y40_02105 [Candidatus Margulisbacteria bacterium GWF2_35_9]|nr:MAG: hypothetical protein A2Y40_02105 [Candidatus Margulisbacteria bacterium GWF2_35_9]